MKNYLNLTNGLEWWNEVEYPQLIRIESTAIEHHDWWRILRDLDADFLMNLAIGNECHVYDCGTRRQTSKTISIGIPFIKEHLSAFWEGRQISLLNKEEQDCGRRLKYFKKYYQGKIKLTGHSRSTTHDGDVGFYQEILRIWNTSKSPS